MDIKGIIGIVWRRIWMILVITVITTVAVAVFTNFQIPVYQASTTLRIAASAASAENCYEYVYADRLLNTYVQIATSEPVLDELSKRLELKSLPSITAGIIANTELIKITVEDPNPEVAASAANTLADILITDSSKLYAGGSVSSTQVLGEQLTLAKAALEAAQQRYQQLILQTPAAPQDITIAQQSMNIQQNTYANLLSQYQAATIRETMQASMMTIVNPATVPSSPARPNKFMNYALGMVVGLLGGVGLAFLLENLDTTIHSREEIESIVKLPVLAGIPKNNKHRLDISKDGNTPFSESFRNLATKIQLTSQQKPSKVLLVLGAEPRDGKSMVVFNLAYALAETGKKVIVIDCDLRLPKIHKLFRLPNELGLSDVLEKKTGIWKPIQKSQYKGVSVLTSGSFSENPSKLFSSPQMFSLIESLGQKFDYVLLDTPALLSFVDTEVLIRHAEYIMLVVRRNHTKTEPVQITCKVLEGFPDKTIGLIVNQDSNYRDYGYYKYPRNAPKRKVGKRYWEVVK